MNQTDKDAQSSPEAQQSNEVYDANDFLKCHELDIQERELALKEKEVKAKLEIERKNLLLSSPLLVTVASTIFGLLGTGIGVIWQGYSNFQLERQKFESSIIMDALKRKDRDEMAKYLLFTIDTGIIKSLDRKEIRRYAENPGKLPYLAAVKLIEKINTDVGYYVADANTAIESIRKGGAEQRNTYIEKYNQRQAQWFGISASHQALLLFYFPESNDTPKDENISAKFQEIIEATWDVDIKLQLYSRNRVNYQAARDATDLVQEKLNNFNLLCRKRLTFNGFGGK